MEFRRGALPSSRPPRSPLPSCSPRIATIPYTLADGVDIGGSWTDARHVVHRHSYPSVAGYDLSTGWGTPTCGLIDQLSNSMPLTKDTTFSSLELTISTGKDNLEPWSEATAVISLANGSTLPQVTLKQQDA